MNIYQVISEEIEDTYRGGWNTPEDDYFTDTYWIAELGVAKSRGQAKYMAWKKDKVSDMSTIVEMPKMSVRLVKKMTYLRPCFVTTWPEYQELWSE